MSSQIKAGFGLFEYGIKNRFSGIAPFIFQITPINGSSRLSGLQFAASCMAA